MKTYVYGYYGKCEENNGYRCVKDYIEADNLKNCMDHSGRTSRYAVWQ